MASGSFQEKEMQRRFSRFMKTSEGISRMRKAGVVSGMFELKSSRGGESVPFSEVKDQQWVEGLRACGASEELRLLRKAVRPTGHKISDMSVDTKPCDYVWFDNAGSYLVFGFKNYAGDSSSSWLAYVVDTRLAFWERFDEKGEKKKRGSFSRAFCERNARVVIEL